ncbi:MAG: ChbG/HpnK family deacetylase [Caldilineaceae bacterium]|nr:ChbG/HpnK family deacetylase [Caldilineaceae bacterium]
MNQPPLQQLVQSGKQIIHLTKSQTNRLVGFPPDARLLIINADDFGLCHAFNAAIFRTLTQGVVPSATVMMPCPWALHAMHLLQERPELDFGVHLTSRCQKPRGM